MQKSPNRIYLTGGYLELSSTEDFMQGTLFDYSLCIHGFDSDYCCTERGFRTSADALAHGLHKHDDLMRRLKS